ncbi:MAG: hypothetical protein RLW42_25120, partial [Gammaproteobacteria bacterium]
LRLWMRDRALSRGAWRRLAPPLAASQFAAALAGPGARRPGLGRLLRQDLVYATLRLRGTLQRAGGSALDAESETGHDLLA